jgi:hypothetical protein
VPVVGPDGAKGRSTSPRTKPRAPPRLHVSPAAPSSSRSHPHSSPPHRQLYSRSRSRSRFRSRFLIKVLQEDTPPKKKSHPMQRFLRASTSSRAAASCPQLSSRSMLRSAATGASLATAAAGARSSPGFLSALAPRRAFSTSVRRPAKIQPSTPVLDDDGSPALSHIRTLAVIAHVDHVRRPSARR